MAPPTDLDEPDRAAVRRKLRHDEQGTYIAEILQLRDSSLARWEGFLFVNLAEEPGPFEAAFRPLIDRFRRFNLPRLTTARQIDYDVRANWKLVVENYSECYHCPLIHPALTRLSPPESGRNDLVEGAFLGGYMTLRHPQGSMTTTGETTDVLAVDPQAGTVRIVATLPRPVAHAPLAGLGLRATSGLPP